MRTSVLDSPDIGERAKEIAAERLRNIIACACKRPDGGGEIDTSACPIHRPEVPVDLLCGLRADEVCDAKTAEVWREQWRREYQAAVAGGRVLPHRGAAVMPSDPRCHACHATLAESEGMVEFREARTRQPFSMCWTCVGKAHVEITAQRRAAAAGIATAAPDGAEAG